MTASFTVTTSRSLDLVHIVMSGFFREPEVLSLIQARDAANATLLCAPNQQVTLFDIRELAIQPMDTVIAFRDALSNPIQRSRRLAFVTAKTLARMQIERAVEGPVGMFFSDVAEARAWLLRPARQAA